MTRNGFAFIVSALLVMFAGVASSQTPGGSPGISITPGKMSRTGTVDDRFQSFNVEMIEVTGGRFWKPYKDIQGILKGQAASKANGAVPSGMDPGLYQQRPPIDLSKARLRKLAAALGPAYMRVSGTWANTTYFHDADTPAPVTPPQGFGGVLTRQQWKGVIDFASATDAKLVSSFATGQGTRDVRGVWIPTEARKVLAYTKSIGGKIVAAEFMNEPTFAAMGGAPKGYDAAAYARDVAVFRRFAKQAAPDMVILGPGSVGEGASLGGTLASGRMPFIKSEDLLAASGHVVDAFSYHFYGAVSNRCGSQAAGATTTPEAALSEDWLSRTDKVEEFYRALRDRFEPGKPLWITETADAACGGNPWASTFLDSFRYVEQLGRMAKRGVQVVAHNTLAASDYGLLDENTLTPRPNYWAAVLWRKFMGYTVLDPGVPPGRKLDVYAHCLRGSAGGVALLVVNTDRAATQALTLPTTSDRYTLTADKLEDTHVRLNGRELKLGAGDAFPQFVAARTAPGRVTFAPASITFLAVPNANNSSCR